MSARTWTVALPPGMQLINANRKLHHLRRADLVREIRGAAFALTKAANVPPLRRAHIIAEFRPPNRCRRDVHNLFPSAKAAVDGVVDAGVLPDDSDAYLLGPDMRIGQVRARGNFGEPLRHGQLVLHITELEVTR